MKKIISVHWQFKEDPTRSASRLCDVLPSACDTEGSIVLRPVIRQKRGGRLRECKRCAAIGKKLGIP